MKFNSDNVLITKIDDHPKRKPLWSFQNPSEMEELIKLNDYENRTKEAQKTFIIKKINESMMYYLLTQCEGYSMNVNEVIRTGECFYIRQIYKNDEIVVDFEEILKKEMKRMTSHFLSCIKRREQVLQMAELIQNEKGILFEFNNSIKTFELISFIDEDENELSIIEFINTYGKYNDLFELLFIKDDEDKIVDDNENNEIIDENVNQNEIIENNNENDNENEINNELLSSFNNTLITLCNKLHYLITFNNPNKIETNTFIQIQPTSENLTIK